MSSQGRKNKFVVDENRLLCYSTRALKRGALFFMRENCAGWFCSRIADPSGERRNASCELIRDYFLHKMGRSRIFRALRSNMEVETMRVRITLACTECKQRNYNLTKDKKTHPERMETNKYCKFCRKHTVHKETK